jgi:hypothetical protein
MRTVFTAAAVALLAGCGKAQEGTSTVPLPPAQHDIPQAKCEKCDGFLGTFDIMDGSTLPEDATFVAGPILLHFRTLTFTITGTGGFPIVIGGDGTVLHKTEYTYTLISRKLQEGVTQTGDGHDETPFGAMNALTADERGTGTFNIFHRVKASCGHAITLQVAYWGMVSTYTDVKPSETETGADGISRPVYKSVRTIYPKARVRAFREDPHQN